MYLAYGFEPRSVQAILPDLEGIDREEVLRLLEDAQQRVFGIEKAGRSIRNPELNTRLTRISTLAKDILNDLSDDPRDIRRSRKFLNVYLDGVEKVVAGYAKTHTQAGSEQLEDNFRSVLVAIEDTFQEQRKKLIDNDVFDLDVQMEVLATQLKREGIM
jgi:5-bromo-4-chloroindolyl phosphate hydrolysis protein